MAEHTGVDLRIIRIQHALGYGVCHVEELIEEVERLRAEGAALQPAPCSHRWETIGTDGTDGKSDLNWCQACGALMGAGDTVTLAVAALQEPRASASSSPEKEIRCRHCGEDIRFIDDEWTDRETAHTCEVLDAEGLPRVDSPKHQPLMQGDELDTVTAVTAIVREADRAFQKVGGGSRHWVRDCFLPMLNADGFQIEKVGASASAPPAFTEDEVKDVLTCLYQDGHVDLVLADRIAALMHGASASALSPEPAQRCASKWATFDRCVRPVGHEELHLTSDGFMWPLVVTETVALSPSSSPSAQKEKK